MIKRENVQIFYSMDRESKLTGVIVLDSTKGSLGELEVFRRNYDSVTGNVYKKWLNPVTPEWVWTRFLYNGFASQAIQFQVTDQFKKISGFKKFLEYIYD